VSTQPTDGGGLTVTAVICTRNRADWARRALESLVAQDLDHDRFDVLVVDNGSTDDTAAMAQAVAGLHANVRWCSEPEAGLSRARNRAIDEARGDILAFLDDDAVAYPSWARLHLEAFETDTTVLATGGPIILEWPDGRPSWLPEEHDSMYAALDLGSEPQTFAGPPFPFGANMAIRRDAFDAVGRFSVDLGRRDTNLVSGEERDLLERVHTAGARIIYIPLVPVIHHVLPDRTRWRWLLRRFFDQGRSKVLIDDVRSRHGRPYWLRRGGLQLARSVGWAGQAIGRAIVLRPWVDVIRALTAAAKAAGTAWECLWVTARRPTR